LLLWQNTRVVRSLAALALAQAADLVVSAVGYNSFHEVLYHRIPTLFIPQTAPYMDDQERRAQAAADRGLAEMVLPDDLMMLQRRLGSLLTGDGTDALRRRLSDVVLPRPGNAAAAAQIAGGADDARRLA
jgi:predicted glycosyltransferase